jgi:geranylgeranyl diphosphate synthase type II
MRLEMNNDFNESLKIRTKEVNEIVSAAMPKSSDLAALIFEAMEYSVMNGGKRLRPLMLQESYRAFGGSKEQEKDFVYPFMAAIECIHSYSLVHDDLPEMDNDMYRRGKLTTHAKYGQDIAVLAGDALLNYASELAAGAMKKAILNNNDEFLKRTVKAFDVLMNKAGIYGMVGGQTVDVKNTGAPIDDNTLDFINRLKTGALLEASLMVGAILAGADDNKVEAIGNAGLKVGLAFQIKDDILDETSTNEVLGKPVHSDAENNKTTYVTLHGLSAAQDKVDEYTIGAERILNELAIGNGFLADLLRMLVVREK